MYGYPFLSGLLKKIISKLYYSKNATLPGALPKRLNFYSHLIVIIPNFSCTSFDLPLN